MGKACSNGEEMCFNVDSVNFHSARHGLHVCSPKASYLSTVRKGKVCFKATLQFEFFCLPFSFTKFRLIGREYIFRPPKVCEWLGFFMIDGCEHLLPRKTRRALYY